MKTTIAGWRWTRMVGVAFACSVASVAWGRGAERWATLEAIHQVENPRNVTRSGPAGELGAYQFREATWRMHTTVPFARAVEREQSDIVARRHYEWLHVGLERAGLSATPYRIAAAWNAGLGAAVRGRLTAATVNYACRVENLAAELRAEVEK